MSRVPEPRKFFLEVPPYAAFAIEGDDFVGVLKVQFFHGTVDAHCVGCGKDAVFTSTAPTLRIDDERARTRGGTPPIEVEDLRDDQTRAWWPSYAAKTDLPTIGSFTLTEMRPFALEDRTFEVAFTCARDEKHRLIFVFRVHDGSIEKFGQAPSMADLYLGDTKKYRKLLGEDRYREFTKAIGLNAHGVGIGAFVYLRRIFERLIADARGEAEKEAGWDAESFARGRMDDKIQLLRDSLPAFLVENRQMYAILSLGVHQLSEQECRSYFEPLRMGIELILDQEIERRERLAKADRARQAITKIKGELGKA